MQTSINLQEPFTYSLTFFIFIFLMFVLITIYLIYLSNKKNTAQLEENYVKEIPKKNIKDIPVIKKKYLKQLEVIEYRYTNENLELRKAYQLISEAIRLFVFEITDITTQNYSLSEIKKINIPELYELIEEYYEPEFASKTIGDFSAAISKARRVINEWN